MSKLFQENILTEIISFCKVSQEIMIQLNWSFFPLSSLSLVQMEIFIYLILKISLFWSCFNLAEFVVEWLIMNPTKKPKSSRKIFQTQRKSHFITTVLILCRKMLSPCYRFQVYFKHWRESHGIRLKTFSINMMLIHTLPWLSLLDPWNTFCIRLGVLDRIQSNKVTSLLYTWLDAGSKHLNK